MVVSSSECSIRDNEGADYADLQLAESLPSSGYLSYAISCSGTVTSIRARGFCPASANGSSNVVMQIFNSTFIQGILEYNDTNITVECNTSAAVGSDYYEGYVSKDDLNINVESGGLLSVRLNSNCSCLLTLGAHARGLRYLVCPSVCVCVCLSVYLNSRSTGY